MKQILLTFFICLIAFSGYTQNTSGTITYERRAYWIKIMERLPFMTQEDIDRDRLTWGKREGRAVDYVLHFDKGKSIYQRLEKDDDYGYSWKRDKYQIIRDHNKGMSKDWIDLLGKTYVIEDKTPSYKWKILNEIKEVAGYLCMKAETTDTVKNQVIHAWFTNLIPAQAGPEGYDGLPGMILALDINDGDATVVATKVDLKNVQEELPIPKKMKGKNITRKELNTKIAKHIKLSIEGRKNPFWQIRY